MKKFLKTLVVGLCLFTLLCCALPAAFAADKTSGSKKEENVYAIGMDAQGGICSTVVRQAGEHARAAYHDGLHL
jgi:hypothetical protein